VRGYIITENEMELLHTKLEKYFRDMCDNRNENWNTSSLAGQTPTVYDNYLAANYVVRRWVSDISK
jgi:hypothetical protein